MSRELKGPSPHARGDLGALFPVLEVVMVDNRRVLVLGCPGKHRVVATNVRREPNPKKGRCKLCPRPTCGATHRDGRACDLPPRHRDARHERDGVPWSGDARTSSP